MVAGAPQPSGVAVTSGALGHRAPALAEPLGAGVGEAVAEPPQAATTRASASTAAIDRGRGMAEG